MAVDLRRVFESFLRKYGHDVILERHDSEDNITRYERHTTRHMYPGSGGLAGINQEQIEGITYDAEMLYYFKWNVNPREGEALFELDPRYKGFELNGATRWKFSFAIPMRGIGGRVEYWVVGVDRTDPS